MVSQIFIVEDHPVVLSAYEALLKRELDLKVCGTASSGEEALILIPDCQPDIALIDIRLPGIDGLSLTEHLYQARPRLPILIVSSYEPHTYIKSKVYYPPPNIKGHIRKQEAGPLLVPTIRQVLSIHTSANSLFWEKS
jgi:DNA-binding NarL/FixJ family response regulator